jgi:mannitol/fructose-specific phosphotransferase system IIA component (Ntr-type)
MPDLPLPLTSSPQNRRSPLTIITADAIAINLEGKTKEAIINELLDILVMQGKLMDRSTALKVLLNREQTMSTGISNGIAIPHAKTTTVQELAIAIGIKKSGLDFNSPLDDKTNIIILALAPPNKAMPLYKFILAITTALNDDTLRSKLLASKTSVEIAELLQKYSKCV